MNRAAISVIAIPALLLLGACGKYGSMAEADSACEKWVSAGGTTSVTEAVNEPFMSFAEWKQLNPSSVHPKEDEILYDNQRLQHALSQIDNPTGKATFDADNRRCELESETKQFLGYENGKDGVARRFRY